MASQPIFGTKLALLIGAVGIAYFLFSNAPLIWPGIVAFRRRASIERPWLFICSVACLNYGLFTLLLFVLFVPAEAYNIFIAPQLEEAGRTYGRNLVIATRFVANYWWLVLPPIQFLTTYLVTRRLAAAWPVICAGLASNNSFKPKPLRGSA